MKDEIILDDFESHSQEDDKLINSVRWWEGKRILYNIVLACTELFIMVNYYRETINYGIENAIIETIAVNLIANIFFCLGWGLEIMLYYYLKAYTLSNTSRWVLFLLGILFTVLLTLFAYSNTLFTYQYH